MYREHASIESLELGGFLARNAVLDGGKVEVAFSVVNTLALRTKTFKSACAGLVGLIGKSKSVACGGNVLLLDKAYLLFLLGFVSSVNERIMEKDSIPWR